jgi:hypothetical protein
VTIHALWKILKDIVTLAVLASWFVLLGGYFAFREQFDELEGHLFPVVTGTTITAAAPADGGNKTHLKLEFIKLRRCDPNAVIVVHYIGQSGAQEIVPNRWLGHDEPGRLVSRDLGFNQTRWWELDVPWWMAQKDQFQIEVIHKCHDWWNTRTTMYVGTLTSERQTGRVHDFP